ncbi:hypothetical protein JHK85_050744 [Glycine max]|nr:hypothetical protein JHK85_050744 [Glycine max]
MSSMSISSSSGRLPTSCGLWMFSSIFLWFKLFIRNNRLFFMDKVISGRTANNTLVKGCKRRYKHSLHKQPHPYLSTPAVEPTSLTQPNEPEFTSEPDLPNNEFGPFSEVEDKRKNEKRRPVKTHGQKSSHEPVTSVYSDPFVT